MYSKPESPQPIGSVLDSGFSLYRYSLKDTFLFGLVGGMLTAPINRFVQSAVAADPTAALATTIPATLAVVAIAILCYTPIIARIHAVHVGERLSASDALRFAVRRFPVVLGVGVLFAIAIVVGLILLLVPGIYLMVAFGFCFVAAIVEPKGVIDSFRYSHELVRGHWWRTAALLTVIAIVVGVLYVLFGIVIGIFVAFGTGQGFDETALLPWWVDFIASPLMAGLVLPLTYAMYITVYADLKLRREGSDIAARIAAAEA